MRLPLCGHPACGVVEGLPTTLLTVKERKRTRLLEFGQRTQGEGEDATRFGAKHLEVMPQHFQRLSLLAQLAHKARR